MALPLRLLLLLLAIAIRSSSAQQLPSDTAPNVIYFNTQNFAPGSAFERNLQQALDSVISRTRSSPDAAVGSPPDAAYARGQCYRNLSPVDCEWCLREANRVVMEIARLAIGVRFFSNSSDYSCFLQYENVDFLGGVTPRPGNQTMEESPVPPLLHGGTESSFPLGIVVGVLSGALFTLIAACGFFFYRRKRSPRRRRRRKNQPPAENLPVVEGANSYTYRELETATGGFSDDNKLGRGAFGPVFKGVFKDGSSVAVKKLDLQSKQGQREFLNELSIITSIQHKNLAKLRGYCLDGDDRILVYEYQQNKSLDRLLFDESGIFLDWPTRFQIVLGIANGLAYLHEGSQKQIIHRDIKASNILLDEKLNPKISDFGISKLFNQEKGFTSTVVAGTLGYLAPEYILGGLLTVKADVFSFGVLTLEIVSGKRCNEQIDGALLLHWAWTLHENNRDLEIADEKLDIKVYSEEVLRVIQVALACSHENSAGRPSMGDAVAMLSGYKEVTLAPRMHGIYLEYLSNMDSDSSRLLSSTFGTGTNSGGGTSMSVESRV